MNWGYLIGVRLGFVWANKYERGLSNRGQAGVHE